MPRIRQVFILKKDIENIDDRPRKGPFRDMPDEFEAGDVFVREVVVPTSKTGQAYDAFLYLDEDSMPVFPFEHGTPMYEVIARNVQRAGPTMGRLLHEYDCYDPETVAAILERVIEAGLVTIRQLEDTLISYRRSNDYDLLEEDDVLGLPKEGRSKLDDDEGGTDPTRADYDPDMDHYEIPEDAEDDDEDDGPKELTAKAGLEETYQDWLDATMKLLSENFPEGVRAADKHLREAWEDGLEPGEYLAWYTEQTENAATEREQKSKTRKKRKPAAKKPAKKKPAAKKPTKKKPAAKKRTKKSDPAIAALADKVYGALAQTPGKTRKLETIAQMVGADCAAEVYRAMDYLYTQGRIDDKGRAVIE